MAATRRRCSGSASLALALTGLAAWLFTSLALRPLAPAAGRRRARDGRARTSRRRCPTTGPDEVRALAAALNAMLARLQALDGRDGPRAAVDPALRRRRRPRAAHAADRPAREPRRARAQPRTCPPTSAQALVRDTIAEQDRIVHLLEGLQALARGDAAERLPREEVELGDVLDAAVYGARRAIRASTTSSPAASTRARSTAGRAACGCWSTTCSTTRRCTAAGSVGVGLGARTGRWSCGSRTTAPGSRSAERARLLEPFARGDGTSAPAAPAWAWRSSPSRSRCTAASCSSATRRSAGWRRGPAPARLPLPSPAMPPRTRSRRAAARRWCGPTAPAAATPARAAGRRSSSRPAAASRSSSRAARRTRPTTAWSTPRRSRACARCRPAADACIVTDSPLMLDSMTKWIHGWKRKGWKTAAGSRSRTRTSCWRWRRRSPATPRALALGQAGTRPARHAHKALNDRADQLAVAASHAAA